MIHAQNITFRYPRDQDPALIDVSVTVEPGEVVGIVGPNGSGKSTLGRILKGILFPTSGDVSVDGCDTVYDNVEARKRVGLLFQNPDSQIVNSVVEHEVAFGPENLALPSTEIRERVDEALQTVGLSGQELEECHSLSMAAKQRVALAAIMAMRPRYLILDEPTAWIEPRHRWPLLQTVLAWGTTQNVGLVLITHRMDEAQLCARLYGMRDGRVDVVGTPEAVLGNSTVRDRLSLDTPDTWDLAGELRESGADVPLAASPQELADALWRS